MTRKARPPIPIYSALADSTRCRIIELLLEGPTPVHRLAEAFSISRPAISRHLRVLKTAGLVAEVKKGRENLYAFRRDRLGKAVTWIETILQPAPDQPQARPVEPAMSEIIVAHQVTPDPEPAGADPSPAKTPRPKKPVADPLNQMGFDF